MLLERLVQGMLLVFIQQDAPLFYWGPLTLHQQ